MSVEAKAEAKDAGSILTSPFGCKLSPGLERVAVTTENLFNERR